ncbi:MAG: hypothetical protein A3E82_05745 [Gammaproteobacteria bacterium RIFCSPHIGHO2_12_FULL_38_11]|nr:MAG: hypothetical protein A3E82_05745 [Gammaproteobacteria bacterium RIFCSPHIGHO2_12_FULL_38_11]
MSESRKRPHNEPLTTSSASLLSDAAETLIRNFAEYENEEARIRLLDRLRKSPDGLKTMECARGRITIAMKKLGKDYFTGSIPSKFQDEYDNYELLLKHLISAFDRHSLEKQTNTNLSIYSPTLGRRSE